MPITDLTGTKWVLKRSICITQNITYSVDCSYDGYDFETIDFRYYTIDGKTWKSLWLDGYEIITATVQDNPIDNLYSNQILEITGGTDATNPDLIAWLAQNAVYQAPQPVTPSITVGNLSIEKEYLGNLPIEKMYLGNILLYEASSPSKYDYNLDGQALTINSAPYSQSGSELTIE